MYVCHVLSQIWKLKTKSVFGILSLLLLMLVLTGTAEAQQTALVRASNGVVYQIRFQTRDVTQDDFDVGDFVNDFSIYDETGQTELCLPTDDAVTWELYTAARVLAVTQRETPIFDDSSLADALNQAMIDLGIETVEEEIKDLYLLVIDDIIQDTALENLDITAALTLPAKVITTSTSIITKYANYELKYQRLFNAGSLAQRYANTAIQLQLLANQRASELWDAISAGEVFDISESAFEINENTIDISEDIGLFDPVHLRIVAQVYEKYAKEAVSVVTTLGTETDSFSLDDITVPIIEFVASLFPTGAIIGYLSTAGEVNREKQILELLNSKLTDEITGLFQERLQSVYNEAASDLFHYGFCMPDSLTIENIELRIGNAPILKDIASNFNNPDGDELDLSLHSTNENIADIKWILFRPDGELEFRSFLEIRPKIPGTTEVTVTATFPNKLAIRLTFTVIVTEQAPFEAPEPVRAIDPISLTLEGGATTVDVEQNFNATNPLTFSADSIPSGIVTTSVSGTIITITPVSPGPATVEVTARDTVNTSLTAIQTIPVLVRQSQATIVRPANTDPIWRPVTSSNPRAEGLRKDVSVIVDGLASGNILNVRNGAGTNYQDIGDVTNGDYGTITDGPRSANGFTWWEIDWDTERLDGWSAEVVGGVQLLFRRPPDLEIRDLDVSDSEVAPGEEIELEIEIRNNGPGESAATDVYIYYSENRHSDLEDLSDDSDVRGGWRLSVPSIRERRTETLTYRVDAPTAIDSYYYGALLPNNIHTSDNTDHLDEDAIRNNLAREERVRVIGSPDYIVESISLSGNRTILDPGDSFTLRTTVRNIGLGEPSSSPTLDYYRSSDARISTSDSWLDDDTVSRLDTNETDSESISLTAPTEPGVYYYGACVSDVRNESNRNNNCSGAIAITVRPSRTPVVTGAPDLVITLSSNSNEVDPNEYINLAATIRNQGDADSSNSTTVRYYLSSDTTVSSNDQLLATDSVSSLTQGDSDDENHGVRAPNQPGQYYYYACVDSVTDEEDTSNNCSNFISINVRGSDLVVESVSVDLLGQTGGINPRGEFTLNATIRNQGIGNAGGTTARIYISADQTFSELDDSEVQIANISSLNSWTSVTVQFSMLRSPFTSGVFYCFICLDSLSNETNTSNNCSEPIQINVNNIAPRRRGTIPVQTLNIGTPMSLGVSNYFVDDNHDTLTYQVSSSDDNIATATLAESQVIITPKNAGSATITVTANDGTLTATQTVSVSVIDPNRAPLAVGTISALTLTVGDAPEEIDVSSKFRDPDNDSLKYNAGSNNTSVATVTVTEAKLTITPKSVGTATITVTATDGKLEATQTISVTVIEKVIVNNTPTAVGTISDRTLTVGDAAIQIDVASNFQDPDDDDTLEFSATSDDDSVATATVSGSIVTITPKSAGSATITVAASDGELSAIQTITVTVIEKVIVNNTPTAVGTISDRTLTVGDAAIQIDVASNFQDPDDDDTLEFSATSDDDSVATATVSGSIVTITPKSAGSATITVAASDGELSAIQTITVTVTAALTEAVEVWMPDTNLRSAFGLQEGEVLTLQRLQQFTSLNLNNNTLIKDLTGLEHATNLKDLRLNNNQISDITPLKDLTGLTQLIIGRNQISDITPLSNLTALHTIYLDDNQISNVTPLTNLTALQYLELTNNQISDITPFANLTALKGLDLDDNQISDVAPLENLTSLERLLLTGNPITDDAPLRRLQAKNPNLYIDIVNRAPEIRSTISDRTFATNGAGAIINVAQHFNDRDGDTLTYNTSSDNTAVASVSRSDSKITITPGSVGSATITVTASDGELTATQTFTVTVTDERNEAGETVWMPDENLRTLVRRRLGLASGETLTKQTMPDLTELSQDFGRSGQITDLTGLEYATGLTFISLSDRQHGFSDLSPLAGLTSLTYLELRSDQISDIDPLKDLTALTNLIITSGTFSDITALEKMTSLTKIILSGNQIGSISTLENLTSLTWLDMQDNQISDLSPLEDLTSLTTLYLNSNQVSSVTSLQNLTALTQLQLDNNQITDVSSLDGLTALTYLALSENPITDYAPLFKLKENNSGIYIDINPVVAVGTIPNQTLTVGGTPKPVDIIQYFKDLDNTSLEYSTSSDNNAVVTAVVTDNRVIITPHSVGNITVTVSANNGEFTASLTFSVSVMPASVSNRAPIAVGTIPSQSLTAGGLSVTLDVSSNFHDPDNDTLTYTASSSDTNIATESESGSQITITPVAGGSVTITVTASDGTLTATQTISVTINAGVSEGTWMPDTNLRRMVRDRIGLQQSEVLTLDAMTRLTRLFVSRGIGINDLTGLEHATNLNDLSLYNNGISNLSPLQNLTTLTSIYLNRNQVSDITPLQNLTALTSLDIAVNQISDITPLQNLTALTNLGFANNQVSNLTPLQNLTALTNISFYNNQITDITPLQNLTALTNLDLRQNQISDVSVLEDLTSLVTLELSGNPISDYAPLSSLKEANSDVNIDIDLDNNIPSFTEGDSTTRSITENTASGENIGNAVSATDADNHTLTYSLSGTDASSFSIVSSSGQLQTRASLDYETKTFYTVIVTVYDGNSGGDTITVTINVTDDVNGAPSAQTALTKTALLPNYPNPFNPETWIPYQLAKPANVTLTIYNVRGVKVRQLALGHRSAGIYYSRSHAAHWDGKNNLGEKVAGGVYFVKFKAGNYTKIRKMLIRK